MLELQLFGSRKFAFRPLSEEIETVTPTGQMFFHMVDAFVRFERDVMAERSIAALAAPTGATRQRGRPPTISDEQWSMARKLMAAEPPLSVAGAAKLLRSEEHTSELQSLMRIPYAVFCLQKKKTTNQNRLHVN